MSSGDLNIVVKAVTDTIISSAKASILNKTVIIRPTEPKWINSYIKRQIRQRKRLFKTAKRVKTEAAWTKFKHKNATQLQSKYVRQNNITMKNLLMN